MSKKAKCPQTCHKGPDNENCYDASDVSICDINSGTLFIKLDNCIFGDYSHNQRYNKGQHRQT